jgi:hypothetical protein
MGRVPQFSQTRSCAFVGAIMNIDQEQIRQQAHELWKQAGKPDGKEDHFWLEAERLLNQKRIEHELKTPDNL